MSSTDRPPRIAWLINLFGDPASQHEHAAAVLRVLATQMRAQVVPVYCLDEHADALADIAAADHVTYARARLSALMGEHDLPFAEPVVLSLDDEEPSMREKADALAEAIEEEAVRLTVVHTKTKSAIDRFFVGSFSEKFFNRSRTPVLVLNPHIGTAATFDRITFASDLSDESIAAFRRFLPLARALGATVQIEHQLRVRELGAFMQGAGSRTQYDQELAAAHERAEERARALLVAAEAAGVPTTFQVHQESSSEPPGAGFEERAEDAGTAILALSAHGEHRWPGNIGSMALWLMRHAARPVLVMPPVDAS